MEQVDKDINVRSKDEPQTDTITFTYTEEEWNEIQDWKDRMWSEAIVTEPQTDCNGCKFVGTYDTEFPCANCSRKTKDYYAKDEPKTQMKTQNSNLTFEKADEPQTEVGIAKALVHKAIDESDIADDAYPNLRQRLHDAVDAHEPQTDCETCKHYNPNHEAIACERCLDGKYSRYEPQTDCAWK